MSKQVGKPIIKYSDGSTASPKKLEINKSGHYTEKDLQDTIFEHPELIPISEIAPAFRKLIPICTELSMNAGRLDILFVTENGLPVCVETKLWRNPEARRAVVAQTLEYASELSSWSVEDLQRVVKSRTGRPLIDIVQEREPDIDEADFLDSITIALRNGQFLLLVCGDGIREATENISRFLNSAGHLDFVFALIEVSIFETPDGMRIYQPRTLAKTHLITRHTKKTERLSEDTEESLAALPTKPDDQLEHERNFWFEFWTETSNKIDFDDPNHLDFKPEKRPRAAGILTEVPDVYLLVYFAKSQSEIGISMSFDIEAKPKFEYLRSMREGLEEALGYELVWKEKANGRQSIAVKAQYLDPELIDQRQNSQNWFAERIVEFDNILRPALERFDLLR